MNESQSATKDPICGMTVDKATALQAQRDGKTFYFCSDHCRQKFLSTPAGAKPEDITIERIGDLLRYDLPALLRSDRDGRNKTASESLVREKRTGRRHMT